MARISVAAVSLCLATAMPWTAGATVAAPPREVSAVDLALDRVTAAPLEGERTVFLLEFGVRGASSSTPALPGDARWATWMPDGGVCGPIRIVHESADGDREHGRLNGEIGRTFSAVLAAHECLLASPLAGIGSIQIHPPGDWGAVAERQKNAFLPFGNTILSVRCPKREKSFYCGDELLHIVMKIGTDEALRLAMGFRPYPHQVPKWVLAHVPSAFEIVKSSVDSGDTRYSDLLWHLSPTRTLAVMEREPARIGAVGSSLRDPRVYELLASKYQGLTPLERESYWRHVSSESPDEYQRAAMLAAEREIPDEAVRKSLQKALQTFEKRRLLGAYEPSTFFRKLVGTPFIPLEQRSLLAGMRMRITGKLISEDRVESRAYGPLVRVKFQSDLEELSRVRALRKAESDSPLVTVEGVVIRLDTRVASPEVEVELGFVDVTSGELPPLQWDGLAPIPPKVGRCGCEMIGLHGATDKALIVGIGFAFGIGLWRRDSRRKRESQIAFG